METNDRRRGVIFLAYDADRARSAVGKESKAVNVFSRDWKQLEMFAAPTPDSVVFIQPDENDVFSTLKKLHVRHIVDIRDVPYLTFERRDRAEFFDTLSAMVVDYLGMHELMHRHGAESIEPLLEEKTQHSAGDTSSDVAQALSARISNGPTVVFCDDDPKEDDKVGALLDFLSRRNIKHSPVLAVGEGI